MIGNDAFQEADITGITRPITKHNYLVQDINDLARIIKEAFYHRLHGKAGPRADRRAHGHFQGRDEIRVPGKGRDPQLQARHQGTSPADTEGVQADRDAERPVIYAGGGVIISDASGELREFVRKTGIPITTTLLGLGAFPETDSLSLEMLGMHGTYYANHAMNECDLLIAVGARFDDRVTGKVSEFASQAQVIHIDIDPSSVRRMCRWTSPSWATAARAGGDAQQDREGAVDKAAGSRNR